MHHPPDPGPLSDQDRRILAYAAAHEFILPAQIQSMFAQLEPISDRQEAQALANQLIHTLATRGLLDHQPGQQHIPSYLRITRQGLNAIGSSLPVPKQETIRSEREEFAAGWLHLAIKAGSYHPHIPKHGTTLTRREMRLLDQQHASNPPDPDDPRADDPLRPPLALRLQTEPPRTHYPDLVAAAPPGKVAFEIQFRRPSRTALAALIAAYKHYPHTRSVLFWTMPHDHTTPTLIKQLAAQHGIPDLIQTQEVRFTHQQSSTPPATTKTR